MSEPSQSIDRDAEEQASITFDELRRRLAALEDPFALLEAIFAHSPLGLQIYDAAGNSIVTNRAHADLFGAVPPPGYNIFRDEIVARTGIGDLVRRAFAGETIESPPIWYDPRELEHVKVARGRRVAASSMIVPLVRPDGSIPHVAMVFRDVTALTLAREESERRRVAAESAAARASFLAEAGPALAESLDEQATAEHLASLVVPRLADWCTVSLVDEGGHLERVMARHRDTTRQPLADSYLRGFAPEEHRAGSVPEAYAPDGRTVLLAEVSDEQLVAAAQGPEHLAIMRGLGCASCILAPIVTRGRLLGLFTLMREASSPRFTDDDRRLVEALASRAALALDNARLYREARALVDAAEAAREEAEAARATAEIASRAKDEFLAMLGHELRNPLAPIVTALHLMRTRGDVGAERERAVVERQVNHLVRLVDDLLDVARITRGRVALDRRPLEIAEVVARAVETVTPLVEERRHRLTVEVPARGLVVDGDPGRLAQVVANLLTNAAKYTDVGGSLRVAASRVDGPRDPEVLLTVADNGVGIAPALLPRLFDLFAQGPQSLARSQGGLGIGLALVKNLVELHGGRVVGRSDGPGRGSSFEVWLPAAT